AIALNMAQIFRPSHFSVLGYALMTSRTLLEGFARVVRYQRLLGDSADIRLQLDPDRCRLDFTIHGDGVPAAAQSIEAMMVYLLAFCRWINDTPVIPLQASFAGSAPDAQTAYAAFFQCPLGFDSDSYSLQFSREQVK